MPSEIHLNDIGTVFELTIKDEVNGVDVILDVSGATGPTDKQVTFKKPDNTTVTKNCLFKTDGTDGIVQYTTVADDLDQEGKWKLQAIITLPTGKWSSSITTFQVCENL